MELKIPPVLLYAASWVTITGGVWALFERAEKVVRPEVRDAISRWLRNVDPAGASSNWPATFATVFDRVFGERHLSWKCFLRSCVASFTAVTMLVLLTHALEPFYSFSMVFRGILIGTVFLNVIPDYLSLLETRHIINWMSRTPSMVRILAFLVIDIAATCAIFYGSAVAILVLLLGIGWMDPVGSLGREIWNLLIYSPVLTSNQGAGPWFYSTFFTSVWVWLYALSGAAVKLAQFLGVGLNRLKAVLDIDNKPLRSLGMVSNIMITLLYLILPFVR